MLPGLELPPKGWEGPPARTAAAGERPDSGRLGTDGAGGQREGDSSGSPLRWLCLRSRRDSHLVFSTT